jgi:hypothetical protein
MKTATETTAPSRRFRAARCTLARTVFACLLTAAGCGGPAIDASSEDSLQASLERIHARLSIEERAALDTALEDLNQLLFHSNDAVTHATISQYRPEALLRKILHGKNARQVITMMEKYRR